MVTSSDTPRKFCIVTKFSSSPWGLLCRADGSTMLPHNAGNNLQIDKAQQPQKTSIFIKTAVRTSNLPTSVYVYDP
jgi:hypothetical protein